MVATFARGSLCSSRSALPRARESLCWWSSFRTAVRFISFASGVVSPAGAPAPQGENARGPPPLSLGRQGRTVSRALADNRPALPLSFAALALIGVRQCYAQAPSFLSATGLLTHGPARRPLLRRGGFPPAPPSARTTRPLPPRPCVRAGTLPSLLARGLVTMLILEKPTFCGSAFALLLKKT